MKTTVTKSEIDEVVKFAHNGNPEIIETLDFRDGVRYAIEYLKRNSKHAKKLTTTENFVASDVIGRAVDALSWDSGTGYYEDQGNFIYRCSKSDYSALKRAYKKL